jgi:predicted RNA binding protein YcfA (HicA-like mRNA interferase family)
MPRLPRWTAAEAGKALLLAGFDHLRKTSVPRAVPFHGGATLHPKIIKQVVEIIEESTENTKVGRILLDAFASRCPPPTSRSGKQKIPDNI